MPTTTANLFSHQTFLDLVVAPLFAESKVLSSGLRRIDTRASTVFLPVVSGGTAEWRDELEDLGDAGVLASELPVVPKLLANAQVVSLAAAEDANCEARPDGS